MEQTMQNRKIGADLSLLVSTLKMIKSLREAVHFVSTIYPLMVTKEYFPSANEGALNRNLNSGVKWEYGDNSLIMIRYTPKDIANLRIYLAYTEICESLSKENPVELERVKGIWKNLITSQ
jgi:hypothetical protein